MFFIFLQDNTTKIFYGLLKEPELNILDENDESLADGEEGEKPKVSCFTNINIYFKFSVKKIF
jgi:hypothetical protein